MPITPPLDSITTWISGGTPNRAKPQYWNGDIPWISAATLKQTRIYDSDQHVTDVALQSGSQLAPKGATLILVRGMALHHETRIGLAVRPVAFNQDVKALVPSHRVVPEFLTYSLQARSEQILNLVSSAGSGTGVLDTTLLKRISIWLPEPNEQQAIVNLIDSAERPIFALRKLISKKKAIKQGLMQQLLTGRTRLPQFSGQWRETSLEDLAIIVSGGTPSSSVAAYWDGGIPWCTPTDITSEEGRYLTRTGRTISQYGLKRSAAQRLPAGSLLLCTRATIGEVKIATEPTATNQGFKSLIPRPGVSSEFLYYKLLTLKGELASRGSGSTFLEVSKRDIASFSLSVPDTSEQNAIATALGSIDDELNTLRVRLDKARSVKQGMMQQLLTGRTRLPV